MTKEIHSPVWGEIFWDLRDQRRFNQKDFSEVGLTQSTVQRFERGETMLGIDKLTAALELMGSSISEYEYQVNNFQDSYLEEIYKQVGEARYRRDVKLLEKLYKDARDAGDMFKVAGLAIKSALSDISDIELTSEEKNYLQNHFFSISLWMMTDIYALEFCVLSIDTSLVFSILRDFWSRSGKFENILKYRREILNFGLRGAIRLCKVGDKVNAKNVLDNCKVHMTFETDLFIRNSYAFAEGFYEFTFINHEQGKQKMQKTIDALDFYECTYLAAFYKYYYQKLIA